MCQDHEGVGNIYAGMRAGLPCLVFVLSPRFSADSEPMSDIEGRFQHVSDNDTSCRLPVNRAGVASHKAIRELQRYA